MYSLVLLIPFGPASTPHFRYWKLLEGPTTSFFLDFVFSPTETAAKNEGHGVGMGTKDS